MKKIISFILCIAIVCSCAALAGCAKGYNDADLRKKLELLEDKLDQTTNDLNDAKDKLDQTQQDLEDAQDKIEELEKDKPAKFYYGLNDPYTHYVNGEKVFEFKGTRFVEGGSTNGRNGILSFDIVCFSPYIVITTDFSATMFDPMQNITYMVSSSTERSFTFRSTVSMDFVTEKKLIIYFNGNPIFGIKSILEKNPGIVS